MIAHHPSEEHLLSYAAGALPEAYALVVASHLNYCPACRATVLEAESLGGALLESEAAVEVSRVPDLDAPLPSARAEVAPVVSDVPSPLRPYVGASLSAIRWRTFWPGMQTVRLPARGARLLRLAPGVGMPEHDHRGDEMTIVLQGSYTDTTGGYRVGDVATTGPGIGHTPVADPGMHCVCLTVFDAPLKFSSRLAHLASLVLFR